MRNQFSFHIFIIINAEFMIFFSIKKIKINIILQKKNLRSSKFVIDKLILLYNG